jgi:hypothetical protein
VAAVHIDTRDAASVYPSNVVRRKDLVTMRLPHWYGALSGPDALVHDAGAELDDWRVHEPSPAVIAYPPCRTGVDATGGVHTVPSCQLMPTVATSHPRRGVSIRRR